jgi:hypothetical protein
MKQQTKAPPAVVLRSRTHRDTALVNDAWDAVMKAARESRHARRFLATALFHLLAERLPAEKEAS